jgi:hypothetical protein
MDKEKDLKYHRYTDGGPNFHHDDGGGVKLGTKIFKTDSPTWKLAVIIERLKGIMADENHEKAKLITVDHIVLFLIIMSLDLERFMEAKTMGLFCRDNLQFLLDIGNQKNFEAKLDFLYDGGSGKNFGRGLDLVEDFWRDPRFELYGTQAIKAKNKAKKAIFELYSLMSKLDEKHG